MLNFISHRTIGLPQASFIYQTLRFATKKAGGSTRNGRDSCGKRLGLKKTGGERVSPGNIIVRQRGLTFRCGTEGVKLGRDYTIYSVVEGFVAFKWDPHRKKQVISVLPANPYARKEPVVVSEISESCSPSL